MKNWKAATLGALLSFSANAQEPNFDDLFHKTSEDIGNLFLEHISLQEKTKDWMKNVSIHYTTTTLDDCISTDKQFNLDDTYIKGIDYSFSNLMYCEIRDKQTPRAQEVNYQLYFIVRSHERYSNIYEYRRFELQNRNEDGNRLYMQLRPGVFQNVPITSIETEIVYDLYHELLNANGEYEDFIENVERAGLSLNK